MIKFVLTLALLLTPVFAADEVRYTYDKNGRVVRADYSSGRAVVYTYDAAGRLVRREFIRVETGSAKKPAQKSPR